jgi:hypothetical protein
MNKQHRSRLIQQYRTGHEVLLAAWTACPLAARTWKPSTSDWSAHEIILHCGDSETFAATRIRLLLAEPNPIIAGYDQDAWVHTFDYGHLPIDLAYATIVAVRASTFHVIMGLKDESWEKAGNHTDAGAYSAQDWLSIYGVHLHEHADQIRANANLWRTQHDATRASTTEGNT